MPLLEIIEELTEKERFALYNLIAACREASKTDVENDGPEILKAFKEAWIFIATSTNYPLKLLI